MSAAGTPYAATVGMFDGVHRGHRIILDTLCSYCRLQRLEPQVCTFARHPLATLAPDREPPRLSTNAGREALLRQAGARQVETLAFEDVRGLTAAEFLRKLQSQGCRALVMGFNNHIGRDRLDAAAAAALGIMPVVEAPTQPELENVSSSAVRAALAEGRAGDAAAMLGRPYSIAGEVIAGRRIGRTIGFPTANVSLPPQMLPADGVYAVDVEIEGESGLRRGMANLGMRPTVGGDGRWLEVNVFDRDGDLYGRTVTVYFLERLRGERRFDSLDQLRSALEADRRAAKAV